MKRTPRAYSSGDLIALTVLALLTEQPRHPYEMQRLMRERHNDFAVGKTRSFYDAVERLLRDGLVEQGETSREGRHPERTVYRITDRGRVEFELRLTELLAVPAIEYPAFTAAVSFLGYFHPVTAAQTLRARVVALEASLAGFDAALRSLREELHLPRILVLELEHARALRRAELDWLRSVIDDIQSGRLTWSRDMAAEYSFDNEQGSSVEESG
jgi:DNA-binding PadR family transcriptional regulator